MTGEETYCKSCPKISILQWKEGHDWRKQDAYLGELGLETAGEPPSILSDDTLVYIILAKASRIRSCDECRQRLSAFFHMPSLWWADYVKRSNGFFGCERIRDAGAEGLNTWALFETKLLGMDMHYYWSRVNIFTRYLHATSRTGVLIFDMEEFEPFIMQSNNGGAQLTHLSDPFWVYSHILERVARLSERAVWNIRDQVRNMEKMIKTDYRRLHHDIARHAIHVTETLDATLNTLEHILRYHENHVGHKRTVPDGREVATEIWEDVHTRLAFFQSYFGSLRHRSAANEKRLQNEIAMNFNMGAQHNAAITLDISRVAIEDSGTMKYLAFAAKEDSGTMKTLSLITLTFLPPTFICAVFSMSFFNYADSGWRVSGKFWIYWAFAIPTTLLTVLIWYGWTKVFPVNRRERDGVQQQTYIQSGIRH